MSVFLNRQAAELLELAAKSHRRAADFLELGDTKGCADYADEGYERTNFALHTSLEATKVSAQIRSNLEASAGTNSSDLEAGVGTEASTTTPPRQTLVMMES